MKDLEQRLIAELGNTKDGTPISKILGAYINGVSSALFDITTNPDLVQDTTIAQLKLAEDRTDYAQRGYYSLIHLYKELTDER